MGKKNEIPSMYSHVPLEKKRKGERKPRGACAHARPRPVAFAHGRIDYKKQVCHRGGLILVAGVVVVVEVAAAAGPMVPMSG